MKRILPLSLAALGLAVATVTHATLLRSAGSIVTGNGRSYLPILDRDSKGTIYLGWTDGRREKFDLYLVRSLDHGRSWSDETRIDAAKMPAVESAGLGFAEGTGATLHAVWFATHAEEDVRVMHAMSKDQGTTWSPAQQLNASPGVGFEPKVASDGAGHLYVTWYERRASSEPQREIAGMKLSAPQLYDVYFTASDDDGASWRPPIRLNPRENSPTSLRPQIAYGGAGHVYVLWQEREIGGSLGVYVAASSDHGKTWPVRGARIDRGHEGTSSPYLAADGAGHVYAAWSDAREQAFSIYFNTSSDHGRTWLAEDVRLGHAGAGTMHALPPRLAVSTTGRVFVAWIDSRNRPESEVDPLNKSDVFVVVSNDYGKSWGPRDMRLNTSPPGSARSSGQTIVSDPQGRRVAVAWSDNRSGREAIYARTSADAGRTWLKSEARVDGDASPGQRGLAPVLLMEPDGSLVVAWEVGRGESQQRSTGRSVRDLRVRRLDIRTK
jgi:hypothetical protein